MVPKKPKPHRVRCLISGEVQGVFYRAWTQQTAQELKLTGWVRNRDDGTVELAAEGPRDRLDEFLQLLWEGPAHAQVTDVQIHWEAHLEKLPGFQIVF